jgi:hypothetical protein
LSPWKAGGLLPLQVTVVHLIFFDESKNDSAYASYHVGAVVVHSDHLLPVEGQVSELATETFGDSRLTHGTEFHAAEIFHRTKTFKAWNDFDARLKLLHRLFIILSRPEIGRIDIQINCDLLLEGQHAEDIAFMFLCERANDLMKSRKSLGMLIGDRENDKSAARHAGALSGYKAQGTSFAFGREIGNLVDSVHFTQSHLSRFLQLADIYTWSLQFRNRNRQSKNIRHQAMFGVLGSKDVDLGPSKYKEWPKRE